LANECASIGKEARSSTVKVDESVLRCPPYSTLRTTSARVIVAQFRKLPCQALVHRLVLSVADEGANLLAVLE
jgi:hypothetical protein